MMRTELNNAAAAVDGDAAAGDNDIDNIEQNFLSIFQMLSC